MSLVPYNSSDSENEDIDDTTEINEKKTIEKDEKQADFNFKRPFVNEEIIDSNKNQNFKKPKIKFFLPSYKENDEDEDEITNDDTKKPKFLSSKGSGLTSILPPPKNQKKRSTTTSLIPDVLRRKQNNPENKVSQTEIKNNLNTVSASSQSLNYENFVSKKIENEIVHMPKKEISATDYQKNLQLKYEIEKNFGDELKDDFEIKDVNIANQLNNNLDYIKSISAEKDPEIAGPIPSSKAKRKHQITYLAFQAKQNEVKLKDSWAKARSNKAQANAKYDRSDWWRGDCNGKKQLLFPKSHVIELDDDFIINEDDQEERPLKNLEKDFINLADCIITLPPTQNKKFTFKIFSQEQKTLELTVTTETEFNDWLSKIQEAKEAVDNKIFIKSLVSFFAYMMNYYNKSCPKVKAGLSPASLLNALTTASLSYRSAQIEDAGYKQFKRKKNLISTSNKNASFENSPKNGEALILYLKTDIRTIRLRRNGTAPLGFAIRGGWEHGTGIFVSEVYTDSEAEKEGLKPGDQILRVNGFSIEQAIHDEMRLEQERLVIERKKLETEQLRLQEEKNELEREK
ncbi:hypothetical protein RND71_043424 [Anisodus tanguticus]|uniref:Uncharacterized protein n=1 Tax=Anisodus tanguticus TaxID=243964 RepID=A0AAE1URD1_9SOLA|nr:hypothetical protein RND71_043424 [Anisodus tanguticus]